jgi:hypothetical protein
MEFKKIIKVRKISTKHNPTKHNPTKHNPTKHNPTILLVNLDK